MSAVLNALENALAEAHDAAEEARRRRDAAREKVDLYQRAYENSLLDVEEIKQALETYNA